MKCISAWEVKNTFWLNIHIARAEPMLIERHRRSVVVVIAAEEYERLIERPAVG